MSIEILKADITQLKVDAIVNAANSALCGGGGVDGAIHRAAGGELLEECKQLRGCETGKAKITLGYNLPAKFVIHGVGPVWYGGHRNEESMLSSCYKSCFDLAIQNNVRSIAFPAISCGAYRFPIDKACKIAMREAKDVLSRTDLIEKIIFACFEDEVEREFNRALKSC